MNIRITIFLNEKQIKGFAVTEELRYSIRIVGDKQTLYDEKDLPCLRRGQLILQTEQKSSATRVQHEDFFYLTQRGLA
jgi:hypothetical protein